MLRRPCLELVVHTDLPVAALEIEILRPDAVAAQVAVPINRHLRPIDEAAVRHIVRTRVQEPLRMGIDPLLVVERDLITVPAAVHEIRIIVAAARIGRIRHLPRRALDLEAPLRPAQMILVIAAEEIRRGLRCLAAHIDKDVALSPSRTADGEVPLAVLAVDTHAERTVTETAAVHIDIAAVVAVAAHRLPVAREIALLRAFRIEIDRDRLSAVGAVVGLHRAGQRRCRPDHHIGTSNRIRHGTRCHDEEARHIVEVHRRTVRKHPARGEVRLDERGAHAQRRHIRENLIHVARRRRKRIEILRREALRRIRHLHHVPIAQQAEIRLLRLKAARQHEPPVRIRQCARACDRHCGEFVGILRRPCRIAEHLRLRGICDAAARQP